MTKDKWPLAVTAFGAVFINGAFQYAVPQEQSAIYAEFGLNEMSFGIVAAVIAFVSSGLGVSAAWLVPRLGLARTCRLGYAVLALGLGGVVAAPGHALPFFFGLVIAVGMAYLHLANGLVVELAPRAQHAAMMTNVLHGCNALGKACGPILALIGIGWREPFLTVAGVAVILGLLGGSGAPRAAPERADGARGGTAGPEADLAADRDAPARDVLRRPLFWCCGLLFLPIVGMEQVVSFWLPRYLQAGAGFDAEQGKLLGYTAASVVLWVQCAARFAAPLALVWVSPIVLLSLCVCGTFGILVGTEFGLWQGPGGTAGLALCGLAFAIPYPTFFAIACRFFPRHKGLLAVVSGVATSLAFITFTALGGILGNYVGLRQTLRLSPVLGMMVLTGALAIHFAGRRQRQGE
jgi:fucose permease